MRVALDAMGGDSAPMVEVQGAIQAARELNGTLRIVLVGDEERIYRHLDRAEAEELGISVEHAAEYVSSSESAAFSFRRKQGSSIVVATQLLRRGKAEAVVSSGNTGAVVTSALLTLGRIPGIQRPAIAVIVPTRTGHTILLDAGANSDSKANHLYQYAVMGGVYAHEIFQVPEPRVGLLNIGEEDSKGSEVAVQAYKLLSEARPHLNFIGNVEGRDILKGTADIVVCDGFTGNVILKFAESVVGMFMQTVRREMETNLKFRVGALLLKPVFRRLKSKLNYEEYGGAPLLGVNGVCVISHGSSSPLAIKNAIRVAAESSRKKVNNQIKEELDRERPERQVLG
ncbi:MAG: phosphate acyltransferase PlsX [Candidatus Eisenbacteria bacterium]|nr:phosphate acyltransferase PlsX [Candidatus Latescibacterota bacterium]MBD3302384.1 phosphate acyltransferase PlsX [Candidatus Eisenbacteria bacterium]